MQDSMSDKPQPGIIALAGGAEFMESMDEVDNFLLRLLGKDPKVVILPTAAAREDPRKAARNGIKHFRRLGVRSEAIMVVDHRSANDPNLTAMLLDANMVYICGGSPAYLLSVLKESSIMDGMLRRYEEGVAITGSSAGAMVLCEKMHAPRDNAPWVDSIGLVKGIAVLPHFERAAPKRISEALNSAPGGIKLCGIDEGTAAVYYNGRWTAVGPGRVTLLSSRESRSYNNGQSFQI